MDQFLLFLCTTREKERKREREREIEKKRERDRERKKEYNESKGLHNLAIDSRWKFEQVRNFEFWLGVGGAIKMNESKYLLKMRP